MGTVLKLVDLEHKANTLRQEGKIIVTTNGCFDILHVGHIRVLKAAQLFGDVLIVGINSDSSIRKLKGANRPIVPEDERAEIVASLGCVDYVTIFPETTAVEFLRAAKPHIYVKGGDYTPSELPEAPTIEAGGGIIKIIDLIPEHSTTSIIQKIAASLT